jgi:phospho-2-dehydro-3-deoxyheptonate aldolase
VNILIPTAAETIQINGQRANAASRMMSSGMAGEAIIGMPGPCSVDMNRMPNGELGAVYHLLALAAVGDETEATDVVVRFDIDKPRTTTGTTGLVHARGGPEACIEGARRLHAARVPFATEILSEAAAIVMGPHATTGWIGAREVSATSPRYSVRPTKQERDSGIHPLPIWVKSGQDGELKHTLNALRTIMSDRPVTRTRFGYGGMETVETIGNPYVGVLLRGCDNRPAGELLEVMAEEVGSTREKLDREFGKDRIPIGFDMSHAHAKYGHENGGEEGQLIVARALGELIVLGGRVDMWMAETYVLPGKQANDGTTPGLSTTDACIRQELAEQLLRDMDRARVKANDPFDDIAATGVRV